MNYRDISHLLYRTRGDIIRIKREAKRKYGSKFEWPPEVLCRYEQLKAFAKVLGEELASNEAAA